MALASIRCKSPAVTSKEHEVSDGSELAVISLVVYHAPWVRRTIVACALCRMTQLELASFKCCCIADALTSFATVRGARSLSETMGTA